MTNCDGAPMPLTSDALPGADELELIERLRERFATVFAEREKRGQLYPALFGNLALTRILRQNKADFEASVLWVEKFLDIFAELHGDDVMPDLIARLDAIQREGRLVTTDDLPGHNEIKNYSSLIYNAEQLTKTGDPLSYFPLGELNKHQLIARGLFESYERVVLHGWLFRAIELDRMSREQGRLCRVVNIIDASGCTLSKVICRDFDRRAEKMMQRLEKLVPDLTAGNWVINAPWVMQKIFPWAKKVLKIKVDNWFLCQGNGEQDEDLLTLVSVETLRELGAFRAKAKEENDQRSADFHYITRGTVLEHAVEVKSGQRVSWKFVVLPGVPMLPPPEIDFGVVGVWDVPEDAAAPPRECPSAPPPRRSARPERTGMVVEDGSAVDLVTGDPDEVDDYQGLQEEVLHDFQRWGTVDLENVGAVTAPKAGIVVLRWSNEFNLIRAKRVQFEVSCDDGQAPAETVSSGGYAS
ncbi:unnamed protein product [Symbiodinium natans]|uniref:CRAL-TRIO domain-containing protein n=1 Tax=Symbiodinium natans TaxID=878477 RepID=A0A812G7D0_9DINO|nr:unnamed protein product [Symbiodinium natans]